MPMDTPRLARIIGIGALLGLGAACLLVLRPFMSSLRFGIHITGRPTCWAMNGKRSSSGCGVPLSPKLPPTSRATTRI